MVPYDEDAARQRLLTETMPSIARSLYRIADALEQQARQREAERCTISRDVLDEEMLRRLEASSERMVATAQAWLDAHPETAPQRKRAGWGKRVQRWWARYWAQVR